MRLLLVALISFSATARELPRAWNLRAQCGRLLTLFKKPSRDALLSAVLRANVEAPQRDDYIYLVALAEYLIQPLPEPVLYGGVTRSELETLARGMDRAHAAYKIAAFSASRAANPAAAVKTISPERIRSVMTAPAAALSLLLESLRDEVKEMPWEHRRIYVGHVIRAHDEIPRSERRRIRAANDDYFYYGDRARRAKFASWGRRLKVILNRPDLRESAKVYRQKVAALAEAYGADSDLFRHHCDITLHIFATELLEAIEGEFGKSPEDIAFWKVLREFEISMFARVRNFK